MATEKSGYGQDAEIARIARVAKGLGLKVGDHERAGSEANLAGIRSQSVLISRRLDSRTWFVQDQPDTLKRAASDFYAGSDRALRERGRKVLKVLGIPKDEVGAEAILQERSRTAQVDRKGKAKLGKEQKGAKILRVERVLAGCPVWSSNVVLRLAKDGRIAFLQAHWPEVPAAIVEEVCELAHRVKGGWNPPPQEGASPESIEAGIVHSPAAGFVMDVYAAIRVIYAPWNERFGRKLMLHFDRHGRPVLNPRIDDLPVEPEKERGKPEGDGECKEDR